MIRTFHTSIRKMSLLAVVFLSYQGNSQRNFFSLQSAIHYALEHNYDHQKNRLEKAITYEQTHEVLTQGFPKINGNIGYQNQFVVPTSVIPAEAFGGQPGEFVPVQFGITNSMNASLNLQQLIFDGRYLVGVQARSVVKALANTQVEMSERDVKVLISKSYYQAIIAAKSLKSLKESKKVLDKLLDQTKKTYEQGLIEELDVERLQYNVRTLENTISVLETQTQLSISALKLNMGFPIEDSLVLRQDLKSEVESVFTRDIKWNNISNRIELKLANQAVQLKKYDLKQMKYSALPTLTGAFNYGYNSFSNQFDFWDTKWYNFGSFGVQANIPIFTGLTRKSQITQAKLALEKSELERTQLFESLKIESLNSFLSLQNNIRDYRNQEDILNLSKKIEHKTRIKYKEGVGSSFEFANAQNERIQQYMKFLQSELNLLNSYIDFKKSSGTL